MHQFLYKIVFPHYFTQFTPSYIKLNMSQISGVQGEGGGVEGS